MKMKVSLPFEGLLRVYERNGQLQDQNWRRIAWVRPGWTRLGFALLGLVEVASNIN
jgi:hypothetical protein